MESVITESDTAQELRKTAVYVTMVTALPKMRKNENRFFSYYKFCCIK